MKTNLAKTQSGQRLLWLSVLALSAALLLRFSTATATAQFAATLATDKPDYLPGEYVTFTGTGWEQGENVVIDVYETTADPVFQVASLSAVADAGGNISNSDLFVEQSFF